jgi:hypothetical protein
MYHTSAAVYRGTEVSHLLAAASAAATAASKLMVALEASGSLPWLLHLLLMPAGHVRMEVVPL